MPIIYNSRSNRQSSPATGLPPQSKNYWWMIGFVACMVFILALYAASRMAGKGPIVYGRIATLRVIPGQSEIPIIFEGDMTYQTCFLRDGTQVDVLKETVGDQFQVAKVLIKSEGTYYWRKGYVNRFNISN